MNEPLIGSSQRPSLQDTLISVVLPVYNEAQVLPELFERIAAATTGAGAHGEFLFVDDGSTDASGSLLDEMAAADARVRVIHFSRNFGHQAALHAGIAHTRGDAVVLMDSDMQDAPEAIPRFLHQWQAGYDVVYAIRTQRKEGTLKKLLFEAFHRLMSLAATVEVPANAGNFGLIDRRVALQIAAMAERDRYYPGLRSWVGFKQTGIEVERSARYDDSPRVSLSGLIRLATTAMFSFSSFPLRIFHVVVALTATLFAGLSCYGLICKLLINQPLPGWISAVLVGSFFGALNALGICVLGEYLIRIYDQVRGRPPYLIDRTVNMETTPTRHDRSVDTTPAEIPPSAAQLPTADAQRHPHGLA